VITENVGAKVGEVSFYIFIRRQENNFKYSILNLG
jgi:hypothetical protein